ncbi:MAG: hypothetical protein IPJ19_00305 [Planctomycetes bacterium]|nr:hypothetical protein [Planctomycetota bacterium]
MRNPCRIALSCLLLVGAACSSPGGSAKDTADKDPRANRSEAISDEEWDKLRAPRPHGDPLAVRFTDFRSNRRLGLLNESHTDPAGQYSEKRKLEDSMNKIGHDEVVAALVERFEQNGFFKLAQDGPSPNAGGSAWTMTLEVERKAGRKHMSLGPASTPKEREVFNACSMDFVQLYSSILGLQAVDHAPDWQSQPKPGLPTKH